MSNVRLSALREQRPEEASSLVSTDKGVGTLEASEAPPAGVGPLSKGLRGYLERR